MAEEARLNAWKSLLAYALQAIDSVGVPVFASDNWSLGGGTVLMRRYRHRLSRDIDIFVPDPQYLEHLSPDLNDTVGALAPRHVRGAGYLRLYFAEGEVDFIAAAAVTDKPARRETVLGRRMRVDSSIEIVAKKIRYRAADFTARDIFDFALVAAKHRRDMGKLKALLRERRDALLQRLEDDKVLRTTFDALDALDFRPTYDECITVLRKALEKA